MVATVIMVAEKPSLAASIANILSDKKCSTKKGFNGACSIHEWNGNFLGSNAKFKMTSVCGKRDFKSFLILSSIISFQSNIRSRNDSGLSGKVQ